MFFSLRNRIFMIFTMLLTVPFLLLSIIVPSYFIHILEGETKNNTMEMMDQFSLYIDSVTSQVEDIGKQVLVNQDTRDWINADEDLSNTETLLLKNQLKMQLSSMMVNNSNSLSISVFLNNGKGTWADNPEMEFTQWYQDYKDNEQRWIKAHIDPFQSSQEMKEKAVLSYLLPLSDISTLEAAGIIKVNFPTSVLENALEKVKLGDSGRVYVIDKQGLNVLEGIIDTPKKVLDNSLKAIENESKKNGLLETSYHGEEYLVFYQKLRVGDWILISEITKSELFEKIKDLQVKLLWISGVIFISTMIASYLLSSNIVKPLEKLRTAMGFMEYGDFAGAKKYIKSIKDYKHEVGYAIRIFDHTVDQLNHLIETEYEANIRRKNAEYKALLLQINPHFMNNTLEIIGGLAAQEKNKEVMDVSISLGKMMRYSLNTSTDVVLLKDEMEYIRHYTDILKVRYEDAIRIRIDEDPLAGNVEVSKFIVQPLVENAVKYSFKGNNLPEIYIKTEVITDSLFILIEDNGVGIPDSILKELMDEADNNESRNVLNSTGNSIGLKNVLGRLKLYYGNSFTYEIQTEVNQGTSIILCIPLSRGIEK